MARNENLPSHPSRHPLYVPGLLNSLQIASLDWSKIINTPTTKAGYGISDVYTKTEVDTIVAAYLPLTGGTLSGDLRINAGLGVNVAAPATDGHARATRWIVDGGSWIDAAGGADFLTLAAGSQSRWNIAATAGHLLPVTDAEPDIGSTTKRIRDLYFSGSFFQGGATGIIFSTSGTAVRFASGTDWQSAEFYTNGTLRMLIDSAGGVKLVNNVGFYNTAPAAKPTITGSRGGNAALASFLTGLAGLGLITDSTTA